MIRYSTFFLLCIFILVLFGCSGKGGGNSYCDNNPCMISPEAYEPIFTYSKIHLSTSPEFFEYIDTWPENPSDFVEYWKLERENWNYSNWQELDFETHKYDSGEEIWNSKQGNCHRFTVLLLEKYEGEYCYIEQNYADNDHSCFQGKDKDGTFYIGFSGLQVKFCRKFADLYNGIYY